jgi:hypothetical protein
MLRTDEPVVHACAPRTSGYCMGGILMVLVVTPQATEASDWDINFHELLAILYVIFISSALGYALYACKPCHQRLGLTAD